MSRGYVNQSRGLFVVSTIPSTDYDKYTTDLTLGTVIPKTDINLTLSGHYSLETIVAGADTTRLGYKWGANYNWNLGKTLMTCNADYSSDRINTSTGFLEDQRTEDVIDIYLRMTRKLY